MDLNEYWQENKRFLVTTASGAVLFLVGTMLVDRFFRSELRALERSASTAAAKLRSEPMYSAADRSEAEKENASLKEAVDVLSRAVAFETRPGFRLDPKAGGSTHQYFAAVSRTRDELLKLAGRGNMRLPEAVGLPPLSPTRDGEIERYLEALDLIDRAVRLALEAGVQRIDKIEIRLDPRLTSRQGVGELEKTRVEITASGAPGPLTRFLLLTQRQDARANAAAGTQPLLVEKADLQASRTKADEAGLSATFLVARWQGGA